MLPPIGASCAFANVSRTSYHNVTHDALVLPAESVHARRDAEGLAVLTAFSMPVYECFRCIVASVNNTLAFNSGAGIIIHFNAHIRSADDEQPYLTGMSQSLSERFGNSRMIINHDRVHAEAKGAGILLAHMSNFCRAETAWPNFVSFCTLSADIVFVKPHYAAFMRAYDGVAGSRVWLARGARGHPERATRDPHLLAQMLSSGLPTANVHDPARSPIRDMALDGLCWRRTIFERLKLALPFTLSRSYPADGIYPATLLTPLLNSTPCGNRPAEAPQDVLTSPRNRSACARSLVAMLIAHGSWKQQVDGCRDPASRCYAIKGVHGIDHPARLYVARGFVAA